MPRFLRTFSGGWIALLGLGCGPPGATSGPVEGAPVAVRLDAPRRCVEPAARTEARFDRQELTTAPNRQAWLWGGGIVVGAFGDPGGQDGPLQVWVTTEDGLVAFEERNRQLVEVEPPAGAWTFGTGGATADVDGDGDLDVFVTRWYGDPARAFQHPDGADVLFVNDGTGGFVDATRASGELRGCIGDACVRSMVSSFGDVDRDGDLDLFVGAHGKLDPAVPNHAQAPGDRARLYLNRGDGTFDDVSDTLPDDVHRGYTLGGGFHDLDADGWLDLYLANDVGVMQPNVVLWNREGALVQDQGDAAGLEVGLIGMGLSAEDLNGDGRPELVLPEWDDVGYLESVRDRNVWIEAGAARGLTFDGGKRVTWGSELADLDNDGDLDLLVPAGWLQARGIDAWPNPEDQPDLLWENVGTASEPAFVEVAAGWGLDDPSVHRGFAVVDLDRDGFLDVLVHDLRTGSLVVHRARCDGSAWARITLSQPGTANPHAVGARLEIEDDGQVHRRTIRAGGTSMGVGLPPEVHVGLGTATRIDRLTVHWPDGAVSVASDLPTRRGIRLVREP